MVLLGSRSLCAFVPLSTQLRIALVDDATLLPNQQLSTKAGSIKTANGLTSAPVQTFAVAVQLNGYQFSVALTAPPTVGACEDLTISLTNVQGAAFRPVTTTWSSTDSSLQGSLSAATGDSITLPRSQLSATGAITFSVTAQNFLGNQAIASVNVTLTGFTLPLVVLQTVAERSVTRNTEIEIEVLATGPRCGNGAVASTTPITASWRELNDQIAPLRLLEIKQATRNNQFRLRIPASELTAGLTYRIITRVAFNGVSQFTDVQSVVTVTSSPVSTALILSIRKHALPITHT